MCRIHHTSKPPLFAKKQGQFNNTHCLKYIGPTQTVSRCQTCTSKKNNKTCIYLILPSFASIVATCCPGIRCLPQSTPNQLQIKKHQKQQKSASQKKTCCRKRAQHRILHQSCFCPMPRYLASQGIAQEYGPKFWWSFLGVTLGTKYHSLAAHTYIYIYIYWIYIYIYKYWI